MSNRRIRRKKLRRALAAAPEEMGRGAVRHALDAAHEAVHRGIVQQMDLTPEEAETALRVLEEPAPDTPAMRAARAQARRLFGEGGAP